MSDELRQLTIQRHHANDIADQAKKEGMKNLLVDGLEKVHQGLTTYEEILRVTDGVILAD